MKSTQYFAASVHLLTRKYSVTLVPKSCSTCLIIMWVSAICSLSFMFYIRIVVFAFILKVTGRNLFWILTGSSIIVHNYLLMAASLHSSRLPCRPQIFLQPSFNCFQRRSNDILGLRCASLHPNPPHSVSGDISSLLFRLLAKTNTSEAVFCAISVGG